MNYKDFSNVLSTVTSGIRLASALDLIGLERRRSTAATVLPTLGAFGVGIAVGAGVGILFAPKRGSELREDISKKASRLASDAKSAADKAEQTIESRVGARPAELQYEVNGH